MKNLSLIGESNAITVDLTEEDEQMKFVRMAMVTSRSSGKLAYSSRLHYSDEEKVDN